MPYVMRLPTFTGGDGDGVGVAPHVFLWHFNTNGTDTSSTETFVKLLGGAVGISGSVLKYGAGSLQVVPNNPATVDVDLGAEFFNNDYTIECWFRSEHIGATTRIQISGAGGQTWYLQMNPQAGRVQWSSQTIFLIDATITPFSNNTWYHCAAVYNDAADLYSLYFNGNRVGTFSSTDEGVDATPPWSYSIYLSVSDAGVGSSLPGYHDDLRISDSALYSGTTYDVPTSEFPD